MTRQEQQKQGFKEAWRYLRPLAVGLLSLLLVGVGISLGVRYVLSHFIFPVDAEDNTPHRGGDPQGILRFQNRFAAV